MNLVVGKTYNLNLKRGRGHSKDLNDYLSTGFFKDLDNLKAKYEGEVGLQDPLYSFMPEDRGATLNLFMSELKGCLPLTFLTLRRT